MDSDRDYTYEELLQRVFGIIRDKNPEMVAGEKKKFVMRPPQVIKIQEIFINVGGQLRCREGGISTDKL